MRQVGTSSGGAGGFGTEGDALGGSGGQSRDHGGVGLRRDAREDARGRDRGGPFGREADGRARAFQDRMEDARRRLGRTTGGGAGHDAEGSPRAADLGSHAGQADVNWTAGEGGRGTTDGRGAGESDDRTIAAGRTEASADAPAAAPTVLHGAEAPALSVPRRLIAAVEPPADALAALFAATPAAVASGGSPAPVPEAGAPAAVERRIADIADRVERALAADLAAGSGAPIALRIPLDASADGLASLTVTATSQGFDVTLARVDGAPAPSPELLLAAQGLAERLQRRLGRGSIRVFDTVETAATPSHADASFAGLSAILGRGTG